MGESAKETKPTIADKPKRKLLLCFCILSFVGSCLTIALFVRVYSLDRKTKMVESKLLEEIQQLKDLIKTPAQTQESKHKESDGGRGLAFILYFKERYRHKH